MPKYLLDTCICIAMIKGNSTVREHIRQVGPRQCAVSEITIAELLVGAEKSGKERHFEDVSRVMKLFRVVPISRTLATYAKIRSQLELSGHRIDDFDMLIGATALTGKMTMVTANVKHFERIPGITIEDWT